MKTYGSDEMAPKVRNQIKGNSSHSLHDLPGKGGDIRGGHKNKLAKRAGRRHMKRKARAAGKAACKNTND